MFTPYTGPKSAPALTDPIVGAAYHRIAGPDGLLAHTIAFDGNTMSAEWVPLQRCPNAADEHDTPQHSHVWVYRVYSYSTTILEWWPCCGERHINADTYSVTTSRHQGYADAWTAYAQWGRGHRPRHIAEVVHDHYIRYGTQRLAG